MTRIVAGSAGGRRLMVPKGDITRPTSERVREALFSILEVRGCVRGARVLDLFAGSGALGLEAASRGAAEVVLVDSAQRAAAAARANAAALALRRVTVVLSSAEQFLSRQPAARPFDLVLLDPPYALAEESLARLLLALTAQPWLEQDAVVAVERSARSPQPRWPDALQRNDVRRYGDTTVWLAGVSEPAQ